MERRSFLSRMLAFFSFAAPATAMSAAKPSEPKSSFVWRVERLFLKPHTRVICWIRHNEEFSSYQEAKAWCLENEPKQLKVEHYWGNPVSEIHYRIIGLDTSLQSLRDYAEQAFGDPYKVDYRRPSWAEVQKGMRRA